MIYVDVDSGGFSNRILLLAHCYATALERGVNLKTSHYADLQENIEFAENGLSKIIFRKYSAIDKLLRYAETHLRKEKTYNNQYAFSEQAEYKMRKNVVVGSWYFRNYDALKEYQKECAEFLRYKDDAIQRAKKIFPQWKKDYDVIIGVHVRRGDYLQWQEGRFYYSHQQYQNWIDQLRKELGKENLRVGVFVCSNEPIPEEWKWDGFFFLTDATLYEDQYCLSMCDYIFGPPSTFSWWAAFTGKKPYAVLYTGDAKLSVDCFTTDIVKDYNYLSKTELLGN